MGQPVTHWQIVTSQPDKVAAFYSSLFGWSIDTNNPLNCRMVDTQSSRGISGNIWPAPPEASSFVQLHIEVSDVPDYVQKATAAGARVIVPPQTLPAGEVMAVLHDPSGIPFVLSSAKA